MPKAGIEISHLREAEATEGGERNAAYRYTPVIVARGVVTNLDSKTPTQLGEDPVTVPEADT
jgi:hypothetical protein